MATTMTPAMIPPISHQLKAGGGGAGGAAGGAGGGDGTTGGFTGGSGGTTTGGPLTVKVPDSPLRLTA